jgi:hypothetical protein
MEGQTVITVTSADSGGATPAIACFMARQPELQIAKIDMYGGISLPHVALFVAKWSGKRSD